MKSSFERRSLFLIIVLLTVIIGAVGWNSHRLMTNFTALESARVVDDLLRMQKAIQDEVSFLASTTGDYAVWDDTYNYMQTLDEKYIRNNFLPISLENLQVDYVLFLDPYGKIIRHLYLAPGSNVVEPVPPEDLAEIVAHTGQFTQIKWTGNVSGYLVLPSGVSAFASREILTSDATGPLVGYMIMGSRLDEERLAHVSSDLLFDIHIASADSPGAQALMADSTREYAVLTPSSKAIIGAARVDELGASGSFVVEFARPRNIYATGKAAVTLFLGVFLLCGVSSSMIGVILIRRLSRAIRYERTTDQYFNLLAKNSREIVVICTYPELRVVEANQAALDILCYTHEKILERCLSDLAEVKIDFSTAEAWQKVSAEGMVFQTRIFCQNDARIPVEAHVEVLVYENQRFLAFLMRDISETIERERVIEGLNQISNALRTTISISESVPTLLTEIQQMLHAEGTALVLWREQQKSFFVFEATGEWKHIGGLDLTALNAVLKNYFSTRNVITTGVARFFVNNLSIALPVPLHEIGAVRILNQERLIGVMVVGRKVPFSHTDELLLESLADLAASTLHRANLFDQTRAYARQIEAVEIAGRSMAETLSIEEIHPRLAEALLKTFDGIESVCIWQRNPSGSAIERVLGLRYDETELPPEGAEDILAEILDVLQTQKPRLIGGPLGEHEEQNDSKGSRLVFPALRNEAVLAVLEISSLDPAFFTVEKMDLIALLASSAAIAYENAMLYNEVEKRLSQLQSLRDIDSAIVSSFNDADVLKVLLQKFIEQLDVDAAVIWLPASDNHHFVAARGSGVFEQQTQGWQLDMETSLAGLALLENRVLQATEGMPENVWMQKTGFSNAYAAPMVAQGQNLGAVEVFTREAIFPDVDWYRMFETLARQGAVALSTLRMFKDLQQKNCDLMEAYNATLEGWAKALDMRDHETRGHSLRVAEMTVELARFMGLPESDLEQIRRGALLHDIGKMGIPDSILLKAGSLDEKEWEIMRLHPVLSAEFLKNIRFLEGAMDIPLYHHEWWNGKGYPRGLSGEEIPLAARIFAVVDVWDALNSDRPYRLAWPPDAVLPYLQTQSGGHFDPQVVDAFIRYLKSHSGEQAQA